MEKYLTLLSLLLLLSVSMPVTVQAATISPTRIPTPTRIVTPTLTPEQREAESIKKKIEKLKPRTDKKINRSIELLTTLINKISTDTNMTAEQKTKITGNIQREIAHLNGLKTKIQADSDLQTIEEDIKLSNDITKATLTLHRSIRRLLRDANRINTNIDELDDSIKKIEQSMNETRGRGQSLTEINTQVREMHTKRNDAKRKTNNTINSLLSLQPINKEADKMALNNARTQLKEAKSSLNDAKKDARTSIKELQRLYREFLDF